MGFKKRQMVFVPEVNPTSFVLFFEKGDTGLSWSIHDYSEPGRGKPKLSRRSDYGWTADELREKARYSFDAPTVGTDLYDYWHALTCKYNKQYLTPSPEPALPIQSTPTTIPAPTPMKSERLHPAAIIAQFLGHSTDVYTKRDLAQRASAYKRKIDGGAVSPSSITRICKGQPVGRLIREAVASVIKAEIPCIADDLLPPDGNNSARPETN
jgi:hypothetical protein